MDSDVCDSFFMTVLLVTVNHEQLDYTVLSSVSHPPCSRLAAVAMEVSAIYLKVPGPVTWIQILPMTSTCIFLGQHLDFDNWEFYSGPVVHVTR
jgi:hypothetical protein